MRYAQIRKMDVTNGEGIRVSLFVQGCPIHCEGCFNKETWNFNGGKEWTEETKQTILNLCDSPHIAGLSILGGEPLAPENIVGVYDLIKAFKARFPKKNIWIWTGYYLENLSQAELRVLQACDVIVDGPFELAKKDPNLAFRGSSNQRITTSWPKNF